MTECPELGALEANQRTPEVRDHIASCNACKLVVDVFESSDGDEEDCVRFDALLAARMDGTLGRAGKNLLARHLAGCATCREVADTLSPTQDAGDQQNLPQVDPAGYELGLEVGRGGMGRILAARDLRIGRPIAVKELLGRSPQLAARFEREARVTARLQHPGIVPIYEIGKWPDGTPFYSMRMVDGRTLGDAIESAKTLAARLALLPRVIAATEAVAFAHAKRVIHRDLTPANVLVGEYGETVVIDWGLAKDLAEATDDDDGDPHATPESSNEKLTGVGAVIGTATYMPPEQAHAVPVDERADVYALGAILYHVLAGAPPYRAKSSKELLRAVKTAPPPPIDKVQPGTPRDLVSIITKAMARDADARYPSAQELAEELKRFQTGRLVEAHAYSQFELFKRFVRRHRAVLTVTMTALVISIVLGSLAVRKILRSNAEARDTVRELILEKGRIELLSGNMQRALAFLYEAKKRGADSPTLQFLLASAQRGLAISERTQDCGGNVRTVAFDPAGKYVAAACSNIARVWELSTGKEVAKLTGSNPSDVGFTGVRFSSDGTLLATWGESGLARVWHVETGELRAALDHGNKDEVEINRLAFSPDDKRISTTGSDGKAHVWDIATQKPVRSIVASTAPVRGARSLYGWLSFDGERLYAMTPLGIGQGWDVETGESLGKREHGAIAIGGELSRDDKLGLSCGKDGRVRVWDLEARTQLHNFAAHTETVWKCIFSHDSKLVLSGGHDGLAHIYDVASGEMITSVNHGDIIVNADFSPDGQRFATVGMSGAVRLWDTRTGEVVAKIDAVRGKDARFAPDNKHIVTARGDGRIEIWKYESSTRIEAPPAIEIGNRGTTVAFSVGLGGIELRDLVTRGANNVGRELAAPFAIAEAAPLVAGMHGKVVRIVDLAGAPPRELTPSHRVNHIRFSADGRRLVLEYADAEPEVWDATTSAKLVTLTGAKFALLSENGSRALAWGKAPVVWNVDAKTPGATLAPNGNFAPIGFARGGTRVALREGADDDYSVSLWNADTGASIASRPDTSTAPAFDPSRTWLTTINADTITVWSTDDGAVASSVVGEQLGQAMSDPQGAFIAAIAEYGKVVLLINAKDGRTLARWPIDHADPEISEDLGLKQPPGTVTWTHDGSALISHTTSVAVFSVARSYSPQLAQLVKRYVPWRFEDGQLWIRNGRLVGNVMKNGRSVPNLKILVEIRTPSEIGTARINWDTAKNRVSTQTLTTNSSGEFSLPDLLPGEYTLTIDGKQFTAFVSAEDDPITIELQ